MKRTLLVGITVIVMVAGVALAHSYYGDRGRLTTEAEYTGLGRRVVGNDLISDHDPSAILRFDPAYRYLGGQKFVLYGVADTEQHFFIQTDADDKLESVYWVQHEAYLPGKRYTYNYDDSPLQVTLGDYVFQTDTEVFEFDPNKKRKQGTDGARAREFLASKGYTYPHEVVYARLVYLTDEARNKELMVIFMDDLSTRGLAAAELEDGGTEAARWPEIESAHLEKIERTLRVLPNRTGDS